MALYGKSYKEKSLVYLSFPSKTWEYEIETISLAS